MKLKVLYEGDTDPSLERTEERIEHRVVDGVLVVSLMQDGASPRYAEVLYIPMRNVAWVSITPLARRAGSAG